MRDQGDRGYTV